MSAPLFYLGTPEPSWLWRARHVPLFVSHRRLARRAGFRRATTPWALDSGGFTEVTAHGGWNTTPRAYVAAVARYDDEIGGMEWAAPQDWMCEPVALAATGRTAAEHQRLTVANYVELVELWPDYSNETCPFVPVLQGDDSPADHVACAELYAAAGVDLAAAPLVGLGSVCRLENTDRIGAVVESVLAAVPGVQLHGFGVKAGGLGRYGHLLASADSQAWSRAARFDGERTAACTHAGTCNWCPYRAMAWRDRVLDGRGDLGHFVEHGVPSWDPRVLVAA